MSDEVKFTRAGTEDRVSRISLDIEGPVRVGFRQPRPEFLIEIAEIPDEIMKQKTLDVLSYLSALALAEEGVEADAIKIAEDVLATSEASVAAKLAAEEVEVEPIEKET